ncbi:MAG: 30S ribosomal protein S20 [Candidatus Phytoplasma cynodontis]|uniref:30S ribosomal protein S20 n=1 Tax='Cynodon dactylon' phytoplasma TaxID=295320 RepID=UPI001265B24E|nr:30S ribosomal protein S20 ['Cynodon dactylon' phytoplasma]KAB8122036.1 30S ribosomal protein S20 ['Cynodon dactylon' phytoplasma]WIA07547.1 MAG: 30S ribosomal protein S20 [Candidatus Phytoplasma cynodontis]
MANIKQQKKRNKTNEKKRLKNTSFKSSTKTSIKKFKKLIDNSDTEKAKIFLNLVNKKLDKGIVKGIFHSNFVAKKKSVLSKILNNKKKEISLSNTK